MNQSDYDYGTGAPGSLLRTTTKTYMALSGPNASSYLGNNLLSLPYTVQVCSAVQAGEKADCGTLKQRGLHNVGQVTTNLRVCSKPPTPPITRATDHWRELPWKPDLGASLAEWEHHRYDEL